MDYNKIYNPNTKRFVNIKSKSGKNILLKYILEGGSSVPLDTRLLSSGTQNPGLQRMLELSARPLNVRSNKPKTSIYRPIEIPQIKSTDKGPQIKPKGKGEDEYKKKEKEDKYSFQFPFSDKNPNIDKSANTIYYEELVYIRYQIDNMLPQEKSISYIDDWFNSGFSIFGLNLERPIQRISRSIYKELIYRSMEKINTERWYRQLSENFRNLDNGRNLEKNKREIYINIYDWYINYMLTDNLISRKPYKFKYIGHRTPDNKWDANILPAVRLVGHSLGSDSCGQSISVIAPVHLDPRGDWGKVENYLPNYFNLERSKPLELNAKPTYNPPCNNLLFSKGKQTPKEGSVMDTNEFDLYYCRNNNDKCTINSKWLKKSKLVNKNLQDGELGIKRMLKIMMNIKSVIDSIEPSEYAHLIKQSKEEELIYLAIDNGWDPTEKSLYKYNEEIAAKKAADRRVSLGLPPDATDKEVDEKEALEAQIKRWRIMDGSYGYQI